MWEDTVQVFLSLKNTKYNRYHPASAKSIGSDELPKFALTVLDKRNLFVLMCLCNSEQLRSRWILICNRNNAYIPRDQKSGPITAGLIKRNRSQMAHKSQVMQVTAISVEYVNNCPEPLMRDQALKEESEFQNMLRLY